MRIALVTENLEYADLLKRAASNLSYEIRAHVTSITALRAALKKIEADVVVVAAERTTRRKLRQIERIYLAHPCPIVMFIQQGDAETISAALKSGISALVVDGLKEDRVKSLIELAIIRFHETQTLQKQMQEVNTTPAERKLIRQAVEILMRKAHISENASSQALHKMALNRNKRTADVATLIVAGERFLAQARGPLSAEDHAIQSGFTAAA